MIEHFENLHVNLLINFFVYKYNVFFRQHMVDLKWKLRVINNFEINM